MVVYSFSYASFFALRLSGLNLEERKYGKYVGGEVLIMTFHIRMLIKCIKTQHEIYILV